MTKFSIAFAFAASLWIAGVSPATGAVSIDQDAIVPPNQPIGPQAGRIALTVGNRGPIVNGRAFQTITAGKTGTLTGFEVQGPFAIGANALQVTMHFSLWSGDLFAGGAALLGETFRPLAWFGLGSLNTQAAAFFLLEDLNFQVTAGTKFSVMMEAFGPPDGAGLFTLGNVPGLDANNRPIFQYNQYAGGELYYSVNGGAYRVLPGDLGFRTYVDEALGGVPEMESWVMMLFGFGVIGAALRRKRALSFASSHLVRERTQLGGPNHSSLILQFLYKSAIN